MFSQAATVLLLAGVALAQTFSINTPPSIQQCQAAALSWTGGTGPYILAAIPAGQVSAAALATIAPSVTGNSYSWTVNLAQGTAITIKITDSQGNLAYSSPLTVQAGVSSSCLSASGASGSGSGSIASTGSAASTASSAASSLSSSSSAAAATTSAASSSSSAAASTTSAAASTTSASATTSRASTAAVSTSAAAAFNKASFGVPAAILAAVGGFIAVGGVAALF